MKAKNDKDPVVGGHYKLSAAIKQLNAVLEAFKTSGIEIPADKVEGAAVVDGENKEVKKEEDGKEDPEKDEEKVEMEGGDGAEGEGENKEEPEKNEEAGKPTEPAPVVVSSMDPGNYESDAYDYAGWEAVPAIFLKQATVNPYWGDLVKGHIINYEFAQAKAKGDEWNGAAGLITAALASATRADAETWFSGYVGDEDLGGLQSIAEKGPILFPGWVAGWKSEADAIAAVGCIDVSDSK